MKREVLLVESHGTVPENGKSTLVSSIDSQTSANIY